MKRYLLAAALTIVLISPPPTLAEDNVVYVIKDIVGGSCAVFSNESSKDYLPYELGGEDERYVVVDTYASEEEAHKALESLDTCKDVYVIKNIETGLCEIRLGGRPHGQANYEVMGRYHLNGEAENAMNTLERCKHNP